LGAVCQAGQELERLSSVLKKLSNFRFRIL
jgi:hypothetical protein